MEPRPKNAAELLRRKIGWRYRHGLPKFKTKARAILGDSTLGPRKSQTNRTVSFTAYITTILGRHQLQL